MSSADDEFFGLREGWRRRRHPAEAYTHKQKKRTTFFAIAHSIFQI